MIHAKARRREEVRVNVVHAEARRRGGLALAAQRPSNSLIEADPIPADAGSFSSASPRLRVNPIFSAPSRRRVNQILPGPPHV